MPMSLHKISKEILPGIPCLECCWRLQGCIELILSREKDGKKDLLKYAISKKKTRENVGPLLNEMGALVMEDTEKVKLLNTFFILVFISNTALSESQTLKVKRENLEKGRLSHC